MKKQIRRTILFVSRYSLIGLFLISLSAQVLCANNGNAQTVKEVNVNLSLENASLREVFSEIENQTNFSFSYTNVGIDEINETFTFDLENVSVADILTQISRQTGFGFRQIDYSIAVNGAVQPLNKKPKKEANSIITGRVTDARTGDPLPGASVYIVGTSNGTATNREGIYRLHKVSEGRYTVKASFIGYDSKEETVEVTESGTVRLNIALSSTILEQEGIVVVSQRVGQTRAFNQQKSAANIKNVVSQEQIQRFADMQVAEGLKRIPGISVGQDYGEATGIQIRSLSSNLNSVTIDGNRLASNSSGNRGMRLDAILASMVESIEVNKTVTPDMDADAIGGSVNFVTKDPSYLESSTLQVSAGGNYNHQAIDKSGYDLSATYGKSLGKFGFIVSAKAINNKRSEESIHYRWAEPGTEYNRVRLYNYTIDRTRIGLSSNLSYNFNENSQVYLKGMYNKYDDEQYTPKFIIEDLDDDYSISGNTQSSVGAGIVRQSGIREYNRDVATVSLGGKQIFDSGTILDYKGSYSYGEDIQPVNFVVSFATEMDVNLNKSNINYPDFTFSGGNAYNDAEFAFSSLGSKTDTTKTHNLSGVVNLEIPYQADNFSGYLKMGSKFQYDHANSDTYRFQIDPADGTRLTLNSFTWDDFNNDDHYEGRYDIGSMPDAQKLFDYYEGHPAQFEYRFRDDTRTEEFTTDESISAAYLMGTLDFQKLSFVGGVRYEYTSQNYEGVRLLEDEDRVFAPAEGDNKFGGFYPMIEMKYQPVNNLNIRAAVSKTLARPNYSDLIPYSEINLQDEEIERGNPELEPFNSTNLDFMVEKYFNSIGMISGGVFYKEIGNYITDTQTIVENGEYAGFELEEPRNASDASVFGVELHFQQQLVFLPGFLDGFGIYGNYTYTESELKVPEQERTASLPDHIPHVVNLALMYEKYGFSGTISLHHQAEIIDSFGATEEDDEYFGSRNQVDIQASQQLTQNFSLFMNLNNITNEPYKYYATDSNGNNIPNENAVYSWSASVGLRFQL